MDDKVLCKRHGWSDLTDPWAHETEFCPGDTLFLIALADAMWAEERAKVQAESDARYQEEFGHAGPSVTSPLNSAARAYCYWRHNIGKKNPMMPEAAKALGQRK